MGGYGGMFVQWIQSDSPRPYNSLGNGSAMRVAACADLANSRQKALSYAASSAMPTHNHPEGVKGAMAITDASWHARNGYSKPYIRALMEDTYGYDMSKDCNYIRKHNSFNETCPVTVPQAVTAFLDGTNFEECIKLAVSLDGDSDTIAAMTGVIADSFYGVSADLRSKAYGYLLKDFIEIIEFVDSKR